METETEYWKKIENLVNRAVLIIVHLDKIGKRSLNEQHYGGLQFYLSLLYSPLKGFIEGAEGFIKLNEDVKSHVKEIEERVKDYETGTIKPRDWREFYSYRNIALFIEGLIKSKYSEVQKTREMIRALHTPQQSASRQLSQSFREWTFSSEEIKREFAAYFKKLIEVIIELLSLLKREKRLEEYEVREFKQILDDLGIILQTRQIPKGSTSRLLERLEDEGRRL